MAHRHGKAGQFGKTEAGTQSKRMISWLLWFGAALFAACGVAAGLTGPRFGAVWALGAAMLVLLANQYFVWPRFERHIDRMSVERIKYLRGGQAEGLVAWVLEDLDDEWHVFNGMKLEKDSDIDHVVVGPGGLFCVSTKSRRGLFTGTALGLLHNGQKCDFAQAALRQTMALSDRVRVAIGNDVPWVQAILALPFGWVESDALGGKVWVVHADNLTDRIAAATRAKTLGKQQVGRVVKVLEMIRAGAAEVYERPEPAA